MNDRFESLLEDVRIRTPQELATARSRELDRFWAVLKERTRLHLAAAGPKALDQVNEAVGAAKALSDELSVRVGVRGLRPELVPLVLDLMRAIVAKTEVEMAYKRGTWKAVLELSNALANGPWE